MDIDFYSLKAAFFTNLERLKDFEFSVSNPLFWIFLLIAFLILLIFWTAKKSFSFCSVVGIVLLAATQAESYVGKIFVSPEDTFDPLFIRIITTIIIALVALYYFFMMED
ncbi:MAG: hypothetical protein ABH848_00695 [Candidatus Omnitrophota bacterium]